MSTWRSPPQVISYDRSWLWNSLYTDKYWEVQEYVGALGWVVRSIRQWDANYYRIICTLSPQKEVAFASHKEQIMQMMMELNAEIVPHLNGLSPAQIHSILPSMIERLHRKDDIKSLLEDWSVVEEDGTSQINFTSIMDGLKDSNLDLSVAYEYSYTSPVPIELCCHTCSQPAEDPRVCRIFPGKLFCSDCMMFELDGINEPNAHKLALPAPQLANMISRLEVYCPFSQFGCPATLPRGDLSCHLEECPYVRVVCVNRHLGCDFGGKTKAETIEHMSSCQYSSAICKELTESYVDGPSSFSKPQKNQQLTSPTEQGRKENGRCKNCSILATKDIVGCKFHSGTWHGYTYAQVQSERFHVLSRVISDGLKSVVHYPLQMAKTTTALGVGVVAMRLIYACASRQLLVFGGILLILPSWIAGPLVFTLLSPSILYKLFYKLPYKVIWGTSQNRSEEDATCKWTCCGQVGSNAAPCQFQDHVFDSP